MTEHITGEVPGFAERERRAQAAWDTFSTTRPMSHDFRAAYHRGLIDGIRFHNRRPS